MLAESGEIVVIGAGPAGLTAAYELSKHDRTEPSSNPTTWSAALRARSTTRATVSTSAATASSPRSGRSKTSGARCSATMLLPPAHVPHLLQQQVLLLPAQAVQRAEGHGAVTRPRCMPSYGRRAAVQTRNPKNYRGLGHQPVRRELFKIFFETYTEKVWGIPCREIHAEWAAQRIKGLSLGTAIKNALFGQREEQAGRRQDADRRVSLSAARARA